MRYNVTVIFKCSQSPETNALDLGLWMCLQSQVEKFHMSKRYHEDSLACTVMNAWENLPYGNIDNVLGCIPKVLQLIVDDQGGNNLFRASEGKP